MAALKQALILPALTRMEAAMRIVLTSKRSKSMFQNQPGWVTMADEDRQMRNINKKLASLCGEVNEFKLTSC